MEVNYSRHQADFCFVVRFFLKIYYLYEIKQLVEAVVSHLFLFFLHVIISRYLLVWLRFVLSCDEFIWGIWRSTSKSRQRQQIFIPASIKASEFDVILAEFNLAGVL